MYKLSKRSLAHMKGVHHELQILFTESLKDCPIDFGIPESGGVRTAVYQNSLYKEGVSKCDGFIKESNHQLKTGQEVGHALDFYAFVNGSASWDKIHLAIIAGVIMSTAVRLEKEGKISITVKWGGTFSSNSFHGFDYPHIEIV